VQSEDFIGDTPVVTSVVRHSTRSTRYDGFRVNNANEAKTTKSKVKPRISPAAPVPDFEVQDVIEMEEKVGDLPPHTPIPVIQAIGVNLCGVPPSELSPKKFLASLQGEEDKPE